MENEGSKNPPIEIKKESYEARRAKLAGEVADLARVMIELGVGTQNEKKISVNGLAFGREGQQITLETLDGTIQLSTRIENSKGWAFHDFPGGGEGYRGRFMVIDVEYVLRAEDTPVPFPGGHPSDSPWLVKQLNMHLSLPESGTHEKPRFDRGYTSSGSAVPGEDGEWIFDGAIHTNHSEVPEVGLTTLKTLFERIVEEGEADKEAKENRFI